MLGPPVAPVDFRAKIRPSGSNFSSIRSEMRAQLPELRRSQSVHHVLADGPDVAGGRLHHLVPAGRGQGGVGGTPILRARTALDQAEKFQSGHHPGEPGQGGVGPSGQRRHPQRALGSLGQHGQGEVVEMGQALVATELRVEGGRQQFEHGREPHPGRLLVSVQPRSVTHLRQSTG